ncbi:MAG TPA: carboxypeptidase-like regulatory domain-containing protein, partial [Rhabdochlamydiaceae bacterium]
MQSRNIFLLFLSIVIIFSCKKEDIETITVEGVVRDDASRAPLAGVFISIDRIKSPSGMGIITDGRRETVGRTTTNANGSYKVKLKVFKEAE